MNIKSNYLLSGFCGAQTGIIAACCYVRNLLFSRCSLHQYTIAECRQALLLFLFFGALFIGLGASFLGTAYCIQ